LNFRTIFDVGANVGEWATDALEHHPQARVHCFEIVPDTFEILRQTLAPYAGRTVLNGFGLSDRPAAVRIFVNPESTLVSSLYAFGNTEHRMTVEGQLRSGSDYMREHGIAHVDYLKIDVEGAEALVLKGLAPELQAGRIRLLHFEYNRGALESRFLLKDFYALLEPMGYCLGKLYPDGVLFQDYRWDLEDFMGPNYVACRRNDEEIKQLLQLAGTR
jgi:FkbM family methyltransferase